MSKLTRQLQQKVLLLNTLNQLLYLIGGRFELPPLTLISYFDINGNSIREEVDFIYHKHNKLFVLLKNTKNCLMTNDLTIDMLELFISEINNFLPQQSS